MGYGEVALENSFRQITDTRLITWAVIVILVRIGNDHSSSTTGGGHMAMTEKKSVIIGDPRTVDSERLVYSAYFRGICLVNRGLIFQDN